MNDRKLEVLARRPPRRRIGISISLIVVVVASVAGYVLWKKARFVRSTYESVWVAKAIVVRVEDRGQPWPRNWNDLRTPHDWMIDQGMSIPVPFDFEQIRDDIQVDFTYDLSQAPLDVHSKAWNQKMFITFSDGSLGTYSDRFGDANWLVREMIERISSKQE